MHPLLGARERLALYFLAWTLLGALLALLVVEAGRVSWPAAVLLVVPPALVYGFVCLAAWYPARALPLRAARIAPTVLAHFVAAGILGSIWLVLVQLWARVLGRSDVLAPYATTFFAIGTLLYLLSTLFHYLLMAAEESRRLEKRELEVRMLAREAELKALKAQLDPHFLFNSLNSISALCGSNPASARTLTTLLAEYLRKSLRIGSAESITLSEELELASSYLAVERIRFGPRLEFVQNVDERVRGYRVPPLLLQPLVENAVTHGIGQLLEGGVVQIDALREDDRVRISVENRCDPDRPSRSGTGIGLDNTRRRLRTFYGNEATIDVVAEPERFRVAITLPG
jgi:two-component system, LytTR family, sensor histidine kinase AlgZ